MLYVLLWLVAATPLGTQGTSQPKNVPNLLNYSGFLTNSSDTTPITDTLPMTFSLWSSPSGGTQYWSESHSQVPITSGYFHVLLGSVSPLPPNIFDGRDLYLETQIGSETLSPRKRLVTVAHAFHSLRADTATYASLDTLQADARYLRKDRPDTTEITSSSGPGIYIHHSGNSSSEVIGLKVSATNPSGSAYAGYFEGDVKVEDGGIHIGTTLNEGILIDSVKGYNTGVQVIYAENNGFSVFDARNHGFKVSYAGDNGVYVYEAGNNGVEVWYAVSDGLEVQYAAGNGVYVDEANTNGLKVNYAVLDGVKVLYVGIDGVYVQHAGRHGVFIEDAGNTGVNAYGKVSGGIFYNDTTGYYHPTLFLHNYHGATSSEYLARFAADYHTKFYFRGDGNAYADGGWNTFKRNSKGEYESFSAIEAERHEIVVHGRAKLRNGVAHIDFPESFSEFVSDKEPINITVTPLSSAVLYIPDRSSSGFTVKCDIGDQNAEFDWIAIGVEKGKEVRPTVPNIAHEDSVFAAMMEKERRAREQEMAKRKAHRNPRPKPVRQMQPPRKPQPAKP